MYIVPLEQIKKKTKLKSFHGTCDVVSGKTADRKNTGQSRIKPDHMQLAVYHIQQCFDQNRKY